MAYFPNRRRFLRAAALGLAAAPAIAPPKRPPSPSKAAPTARRIRMPRPAPSKFSGKYSHRVFSGGICHNPPREARAQFADAVLEAARM